MLRTFIFICCGAGLLACSSVSVQYSSAERMDVNDAYSNHNRIDSIIVPYRDELAAEMSEVIAQAPEDLVKDRPNGTLNNWTTDVLLARFRNSGSLIPCIALLNYGGLRNPISKGNVTVGDIFKLMPFDNEVVVVTLPLEALEELGAYLTKSGGEPIAGGYFRDGEWMLSFTPGDLPTKDITIITSDYLMNGGDNMHFFEKKTDVRHTGILLRDAFIEAARNQGILRVNDEERIKF